MNMQRQKERDKRSLAMNDVWQPKVQMSFHHHQQFSFIPLLLKLNFSTSKTFTDVNRTRRANFIPYPFPRMENEVT